MADGPHAITLAEAAQMTARARQLGLLPVEAWLFQRDAFDQILAQPGVTGLRFYIGADAGNAPTLIAVGTTADGSDLTTGVVVDFGEPCPPLCDPVSALHGGTA